MLRVKLILLNSLRPCDAYMFSKIIIGSDNSLSPGWHQAIIYTNTLSVKRMHSKILSAKWCLFRLGLNECKVSPVVPFTDMDQLWSQHGQVLITSKSVGWNNLSIPKLQWLSYWSLGINTQFHSTFCKTCDYLSMLKSKLPGKLASWNLSVGWNYFSTPKLQWLPIESWK